MAHQKTHPVDKLLVISEMGIGDGLTLIPVLRALKSHRPEIQITMLSPGLYPLKKNLTDVVQILDHRQLPAPPAETCRQWLRHNFQWVWNTENEQSAWRSILESEKNPNWVSAPPHRTWPKRFVLRLRLTHLRQIFHELQEFPSPHLELMPDQETMTQKFTAMFPPEQTLIAIQPGAKDKTKIWPYKKYRDLSLAFARLPHTSVILFLSPQEGRVFPPEFLSRHKRILCIQEALEDTLPKLAACHLFIGNDSGFYHLSYALGLPVVGVFRSRRNMKRWAYPSARSRAVTFYLPSPIRRHWHKFISVQRVFRVATALLRHHPDQ